MIFLVVSRVYQPALSAVTCSESLPCTGSKGNDAGRAEWIPFGTLLLTSEKAADFFILMCLPSKQFDVDAVVSLSSFLIPYEGCRVVFLLPWSWNRGELELFFNFFFFNFLNMAAFKGREGKLMRIVVMASKRIWKHVLISTCFSEDLERPSWCFISFAWLLLERIMLMQKKDLESYC